MKQVATAYIGLGSNMGDRLGYLEAAIKALHAKPDIRVLRCSSVYETAPVGLTEQPHFLNMVIEVATELTPHQLLETMLAAELELGRVRDVRWGPRTIDLDLLVYGDVSLKTDELELPHPRMTGRGFVLMPLADIASAMDVQGRTVEAWLKDADVAGIEPASAGPDWWTI